MISVFLSVSLVQSIKGYAVKSEEYIVLRFLSLVFVLSAVSVLGKNVELQDFFYTVELSVKRDSSIFDEVAELISESEIKSEVKKLAVFAQQDKPVSSMTALNDRLNRDMKTINKNLHLLGYYNAKVRYDIEIDGDNSVKVFVKVDTRNKFALNFSIKFIDQREKFNKYYSELLKEKYKA